MNEQSKPDVNNRNSTIISTIAHTIDISSIIEHKITIDETKDRQLNTPIENKKTKKETCYFCNKKLKMIMFTCRCNHKFCILHQNSHSHKCSFDSKQVKKHEILKNNPKLGSKVEKI